MAKIRSILLITLLTPGMIFANDVFVMNKDNGSNPYMSSIEAMYQEIGSQPIPTPNAPPQARSIVQQYEFAHFQEILPFFAVKAAMDYVTTASALALWSKLKKTMTHVANNADDVAKTASSATSNADDVANTASSATSNADDVAKTADKNDNKIKVKGIEKSQYLAEFINALESGKKTGSVAVLSSLVNTLITNPENVLPKDTLLAIEKQMIENSLNYLYYVVTKYDPKPEAVEPILNDIQKMIDYYKADKASPISMANPFIPSYANFVGIDGSHIDDIMELYDKVIAEITNLKLNSMASVGTMAEKKKLQEIKNKIIIGIFPTEEIKQLNDEEKRELFSDKEVLQKLKELYPTLSAEDKLFISQELKLLDINPLPPKYTAMLSSLLSVLSHQELVDASNLIRAIKNMLNNPFITQDDIEKTFEEVKNTLYYKIKNQYGYLLSNDKNFWAHLDSLKKAKNVEELADALDKIKQDIENALALENFDKFEQRAEKYVDVMKYVQSKYNINLNDKIVTILSDLEKLKDFKVRSNPNEAKRLIMEINDNIEGAKRLFWKYVDLNTDEILKVNVGNEKVVSIAEVQDELNGKIVVPIDVEVKDMKVMPLLDGYTFDVYRIDTTNNIKNLEVDSDSSLLAIITQEKPTSYVVKAKINGESDKLKSHIDVSYFTTIGQVKKSFKVREIKKKGSTIDVSIEIKTNKDYTGLVPIDIGMNDFVPETNSIAKMGSKVIIDLNQKKARFTVLDRDLNYDVKESKRKKFTDTGEYLVITQTYTIHNKDKNVYNNAPLRIPIYDDDVKITVISADGDIIDSYSPDTFKDIITLPIIIPGDNTYYVQHIQQDKYTRMQIALRNYEERLKNIEKYLDKVREVSNEPLPSDIQEEYSKVKTLLEQLKDAVVNRNIQEYTRVSGELSTLMNQLEADTISLMNEKLGKEETIKTILDDLKKKLNEMRQLLINSKLALDTNTYNNYANKIKQYELKLKEIETELDTKFLDDAYRDAMELKPQIEGDYMLLYNDIRVAQLEKVSAVQIKLQNLIDEVEQAVKMGMSDLDSTLTTLRTYKKVLDSIANDKNLPLSQKVMKVAEIENKINQLKISLDKKLSYKNEELETQIKQKLEKIKKTLANIKSNIQVLQIYDVDPTKYHDIEQEIEQTENVLEEVEQLLLNADNEKDELKRFVILQTAMKKLQMVELKDESELNMLLNEVKMNIKRKLQEYKKEIAFLQEDALQNNNQNILTKTSELVKKLNEIEVKLNDVDNPIVAEEVKAELNSIDAEIEQLKTMRTVSSSSRKSSEYAFYFFLVLITVIGSVVAWRNRDTIKAWIEKQKKKLEEKKKDKGNNSGGGGGNSGNSSSSSNSGGNTNNSNSGGGGKGGQQPNTNKDKQKEKDKQQPSNAVQQQNPNQQPPKPSQLGPTQQQKEENKTVDSIADDIMKRLKGLK